MELKYNGSILTTPVVNSLLEIAKEYNILPSSLITQLHFETMWGKAQSAVANNNWGGMTWTGVAKRPSGIVVSRGSARPADEGGHYMRYDSVDDFLTDWAYLLRPGGIYTISGKKTFTEAVKGLFKVGGAKYDYAASGYNHYISGMTARRAAINNANNGALDTLDQQFIGRNPMTVTALDVLNTARKYMGVKKGSSAHKAMIDRYNKVLPRPLGYAVTYADDWCDAFVTAVSDEAGAQALIGRECGVERHKNIFKQKGIWLGRVTPQVGDIVIFRWDGNQTGWANHIAFVYKVSGNNITTIEGNVFVSGVSQVAYKTYAYNASVIQGYARPKYGTGSTQTKSIFEIAKEVVAGVWGNGQTRKDQLINAGYDPDKVQEAVNNLLQPKPLREIAQEVIDGVWGNNPDRINNLKASGYDPEEVQKIVNEILADDAKEDEQEEVKPVEEQPVGGDELKLNPYEFVDDYGVVWELRKKDE